MDLYLEYLDLSQHARKLRFFGRFLLYLCPGHRSYHKAPRK